MQRIKFTRKLFTPLLLLLALSFAAAPVTAQVISLQQLHIDDSIVQSDSAYSIPDNILVVPIFPPTSDFNVRGRDWYRGLFYYLVANERRGGFTDIPFHYVISSDGEIFKGNSGGEERKISIEGYGDNQVVIGYLANRSDNAFDPRATSVLGELIVDVASRNIIDLEDVCVATAEYVRNDTTQTVSLRQQDVYGLWQSSLADLVDDVSFLYKPQTKNYQIDIVAVSGPDGNVNPGDVVDGRITLKNTGEFGIYGDSVSELVASSVESTSKFYEAGSWLSTSQFSVMGANDVLLPGSEQDFLYKLFVPLYFGDQQESFSLQTIEGGEINNSQFAIKLSINKPAGTVVEVKDTETGWLRVRSQPSGAATEIERISTGERYFQIEDAGNGWVKLDLGARGSGWVSRFYLNYL